MGRYGLAVGVLLAWGGWAAAGSWTESLFDEVSKDFGPVPRGPTLVHSFRMVNRSREVVHVAGIRVSCGCVQAQATKDTLAPGEEGALVARMDTRRVSGSKTVTIYVTVDRPVADEGRLWVQAIARDDVSIAPDTLAFGRVRRASEPTATADVTLSGGWRLTGARADSNYVRISLGETRVDEATAAYRVQARLRADTPAGRWYTDVWLETNNPQAPRFRLPLTVQVEGSLTVSPQVVSFGEIRTGEEAERRVVVRGVRPFRIVRVDGEGDGLAVHDSAAGSRPVHVLTVRLKAAGAGELARALRLTTDLAEDASADFEATATVVSPVTRQ